jgi:hypothetical protein
VTKPAGAREKEPQTTADHLLPALIKNDNNQTPYRHTRAQARDNAANQVESIAEPFEQLTIHDFA